MPAQRKLNKPGRLHLTASGGTIDASGTGTLTLSGGITGNTFGLFLLGTGAGVESGAIATTSGSVTKLATGTWTLSGTNTYTGTTTITAGTLVLNPGANVTPNTQVVLNGGTLSTSGITTNRTITDASTLNLNAVSSITLGTNVHTLTFANSSAVSWAGAGLTINGWTGTPGASGTAGKIFFGNSTSGLTSGQLAIITFTGFGTGAILLSTGELVPVPTTPFFSIAGTTNNGSSCVGSAASPQTYTITNAGTSASGVTVTSNNADFVVSGLSSTSIAGGGGTATYQVTFTPSAGTGESATITVASTSGGNSPTSTPTGTGLATGTWIGVTSTNWFDPTNWCGGVPIPSTNVIIPTGTPNQPTIGGAGAVCNNITINNTASLTITGTNTLTVSGNWVNNGTFTPNTSTVTFAGTTQSITGTSATFFNVTVSSGTTTLGLSTTVSGTLTLTSASIDQVTFSLVAGALAGNGTLTKSGTGATNLTLGNANNLSGAFSGVIQNPSGSIALVKNGTGTQTLSGTDTYSGGTTINAGILQLGSTTALGTGAATIATGAVLDLNGIAYPSTSALTINGTGITNGGALINSNATAASFAGTIALGSSSTITANNPITLSGVISSSSNARTITTAGTSILTLSGLNTYGGLTTVSSGTLQLGSTGALGTTNGGTVVNSGAALDLNGFTLSTAEPLTLNGTGISTGGALINSSVTAAGYSGLINLGSASSIVANAGNLNITNTGTITGATFGLTLGGSGTGTISSIIGTTTGTLTMNGTGVWILSANNTYTGITTITAGELRLNPASNTTPNSQVVLNGGILGTTNINSGITVTNASTLNLQANSSINLGSNVHSLSFANSSAVSWAPGTLLTVNNWQGVAGQSGTAGKIFFGNTLGTLTATQLSQITFTGFTGTPIILIGTGEIVPQPAIPFLVITGTTNNGNSCIGTAATAITYTITNSGSVEADGITVGSNNTEFVVSSPSSTTIAPNGGTATYTVTFTATASGAQSATITVASTTTGSNAPTSNVTGTGLTPPVATFNYINVNGNTSYCQALPSNPSPLPNPSPNFTGGGVAGTFSASPSGLIFVSTSTGQVDIVHTPPGTYTVTNNVTAANGCPASATASITINALPAAATISYAQPAYCNNDNNAEPAILNLPGGTSSFGYSSSPAGLSINSSTGAITPSSSTPGTYTVTFTNTNVTCNNTTTTTVTISQMASGTFSYAGSPYCSNAGTATITNSVTGTTTGATFSEPTGLLSLNTSTGAVTLATSTPGTYTVTYNVPATGGCNPYSTTASITVTAAPPASISYTGSPFCGSVSAVQTPLITGTTGGTFSSTTGLSINASTGAITPSLSTAGTYTVSYNTPSVNGCITTATASVTITPATGTPGLNTTTICTTTTSLSITLSGEANGTTINILDNGSTVATVSRTGTTANYTIPANLFHNGDVVTLTALATGKCVSLVSTNAVTVGPPAQPGTISGVNPVCQSTSGNGYSISAVTGATSYTWSYSGTGATITGGTTINATISFSATATPGNLSVTANNTCGASTPQTLAVTVSPGTPASPGSITGPATVCSGTNQIYSIAAVANATSYNWTVPTGWTIVSTQGNPSPSLTVTTGNVGQNGNISVSASNTCGTSTASSTSTAATNAGAGASVTGVGTIAWTAPGNITTTGTPYASVALIGTSSSNYLQGSGYGFTIPTNATINGITLAVNREADPASTLQTDNVISLVKGGVVTGSNLATTAVWPNTAFGIATYGGPTNLWGTTWLPSDINSASFGAALSVKSTSTSNRTDQVDYMQITVTYTVPPALAVTVGASPSITLGPNPSVTCNNATSANLTYSSPTGSPNQYSITYDATAIGAGFVNVTNASLPSSPISLTIPSGVAGGVYNGTLSVTNTTSSCQSTGTPFTITVPGAVNASASKTDNLCFGGATGTATVTPGGGNGTYNITWTTSNGSIPSGQQNNAGLTGLIAGTYSYSVTDGNGCGPITGSVTVGQPAQLTTTTSETDNQCFGGASGAASVTPAGGNGVYTVTWTTSNGAIPSGQQNSPSLTGLTAGTYNYSITDGNNCGPLTGFLVVGQPTAIVAVPIITNACFDGSGGSVLINPSGGAGGPYSIVPISGGPSIDPNTATSIPAGSYSYDVFDQTFTCFIEVDFTIQSPSAAVGGTATSTKVSCFGAGDGTITITGTGGFGTYQYSIDGGSSWQSNGGAYTGLAPNTYNVEIRDAASTTCVATVNAALVISQPGAAVGGTATSTNVSCFGAGDGTITITGTGGYGTYQYSIDGGSSWQSNGGSYTGLAPNTYNVEIRDAASTTCVATVNAALVISQPSAAVGGTATSTNVSCFGAGDGTITITGTGGNGTYQYSIDGGTSWQSNGGAYTGLAPNTYNVEIRDAASTTCVATVNAALVISQPSAAVGGTATSTNVSCFGAGDGTITITGTGGYGTYQYSIDGGTSWQSNGGAYTGLAPNTYNVEIRDAASTTCVATVNAALVISQPGAAVGGTATSTNVRCFGAGDGTITITGTGGKGTYQYSIDGGSSWQSNGGAYTGLAPNTYNVEIRDAASTTCVATVNAALVISQPSAAVGGTATSINVSCFGAGDGTITITGTGGNGTYQYSIDGGTSWQSNGGAYTGLAPNTYNVEIRDAASTTCVATVNAALVISQPSAAVGGTATSINVSCFGAGDGTITITGTGGYGTYQYSIDGGSSWQSNGGAYTGLAPNTYNVEIRDAASTTCVATVNAALVISQPSAAVGGTATSTNVSCFGAGDGTITITGTGGYGTYQYSIDGGSSWQSNGGSYTGLAPNTYNVEIRDAASTTCVATVNAALVISQPSAAVGGTATSTNVSCFGAGDGTITITGTGGNGTYQYSIDGGSSWQSNGGSYTGLAPNTYNVEIRDAASTTCVATVNAALVISQPSAAVGGTATSTNVSCFGAGDGTITITGTGGYGTYQYSIDGGSSWQSNGGAYTGLAANTYNVEIRDAASTTCVATVNAALVISQPGAAVGGTATSTNVSCFGAGDGTITITGTGGYGTYQYSIDGGSSWQSNGGAYTGLAANTYNVEIRDAASTTCVATVNAALVISQPSAAVGGTATSTNVSCFGAGDGTITITGTGGNGTYQYSIDGGSSWQSNGGAYTGVAPNTYNVEIRDAASTTCVATVNAALVISQPSAAVGGTATSTNVSCFGAGDGTITISGTGGNGTYQYSIDGGSSWQSNGGSYTGLAPNTYNVEIRDAASTTCVATVNAALVISQPSAAVGGTATSTNVSCFGAGDGTITITGTGGNGTYQYSIDGGSSWQSNGGAYTGLAPNTYNVEIRDAASTTCVATVTAALVISQPGAAVGGTATSTNVSCFGAGDGTITITGTGGYGTYQYSIDGGSSWQSNGGAYTGLAANTSNVEIRDAASTTCVATVNAALVISQPGAAVGGTATSTNVSCFGAGDGTITITGTGGNGTYQYSIDGGSSWQSNGGAYTGLAPNTYNVEIRDAASTTCVATVNAALVISQPSAAVGGTATSTNVSCFGAGDGTITITGTGGYGTYQYSIDGGSSWQSNGGAYTGLAANTYNVEIRDAASTTCVATVNAALVISQPGAAVGGTATSTNVSCFGAGDGTITITGTGGYGTYQYSIDGGSSWQSNGGAYTGLAANTYNVEIRDAASTTCVATVNAALVISQPGASVGGTATSTNVSCFGAGDGTITITGTGGNGTYQYSIDGGSSWQSNGGAYTGLTANTYNVEIRDAASTTCVATVNAALVISQPGAAVGGTATSTDITCFGANNGMIKVTGSGGNGTYQYSIDGTNWQPAGGTSGSYTFTGLVSNTYTVEVRDAASVTCVFTLTSTVTIHEPAAITSSITQSIIACNGQLATVTIVGTGGTAPLVYTFNNVTQIGNGVFINVPASATAYSYSITDANNCGPDAGTFTVIQPDPLVTSVGLVTNVSCNGANDGTAIIQASGGSGFGTYSYNLDNNGYVGGTTNTTHKFTGLAPGGHSVFVKDENGCVSGPLTFNITEPALISVSAAAQPVACSSGTTTLFVIASGGTGTLMYSIDAGAHYQSSFLFTVSVAGSPYTVTVKDANGCTGTSAPVTITSATQLTASISNKMDAGCTAVLTGSFTINGSGGTQPYMYIFNGGSPSPTNSFSGLAQGSYLATVVDDNGCTAPLIVNIGQAAPPTAYTLLRNGPDNCTGLGVDLILGGSDQGVQYQLVRNGITLAPIVTNLSNNHNSIDFTPQATGTYTAIAFDPATGCTNNMTGSVTVVSGTTPTAFSVTGGGNYCGSGPGVPVGLGGSQSGVSYQLQLNGSNFGSPVTGSGSSFSFGNQTFAGTYTVVASSGSCTNNMTGSAVVSATPLSAPTFTQVDPTCSVPTGTITITSPTTGLTFSLDNGSYAPYAGPYTVGSGPHTLTAQNAATCISAAANITIAAQPSGTATPSFTQTDPTCTVPTGTIAIVSSTAGLTFSLDNGTYAAYTGAYTVGSGPHTLTAKSGTCISAPANILIANQPSVPGAPSFTQVNPTCTVATGTIAIVSSTAGLTFSLDGSTFVAYTGAYTVGSGPHTLIASNGTCNSVPANILITAQPSIPGTPSFEQVDPTCTVATGTITIVSPTAGLTFSLDGGSPAPYTGAYTVGSGPHTLTATNGTCSSTPANIVIATQPSVPGTPSFEQVDPTCAVPTGTISIVSSTAGLTFSLDGGTFVAYTGAYTVGSGPHTLTAKNAGGCTSVPANISIASQPSAPGTPGFTQVDPTCAVATGTITITSSTAGLTFSLDDGTYAAYTGPYTVGSGPHTLMAKNAGGCISAAADITIAAQPGGPVTPTITSTNPTCAVATGTITITSSTTNLLFSLDGGSFVAYTGAYTVGSGPHSITARNTAGCVSTAASIIIAAQPSGPATPTITGTNPTCAVATGTITITSSTTNLLFSLDGGTYTAYTGAYTVGSGPHTITARNTTGCVSGAASITIAAQPGGPATPSITGTNPTCAVATGKIVVNSPVGTQTYSLDGAAYAAYPSGGYTVASGPHTVTTRNAAGCVSTAAGITIAAQPAGPAAPSITGTNPTCAVPTGKIVVNSPVGTQTYSLDGAAYTAYPSGGYTVASGPHTVTTKNAAGCVSSAASITIAALPAGPATPTIAGTNPTCSVATGIIRVTSSTTGLTFSLDAGTYGAYPSGGYTGVASGTHTVTAKNTAGCVSSAASVTIAASPILVAGTVTGTSPVCAGGTTQYADATGSAGGTWSSSNTAIATVNSTGLVTGVSAGTATITYSLSNSCGTKTATKSITVTSAISVAITASDAANEFCRNQTLTATATPAAASYLWSTGATSQSLSVGTNYNFGSYSVTVKNAAGCSAITYYTYNPQTVASSYDLFGSTAVTIGAKNTVENGSVGVSATNGMVTIGASSSVASAGAFVKAKNIAVTAGANVPTKVFSPAAITLPTMQFNTTSTTSLSNLNVPNNTTQTYTGNYRTVTVGTNCNVTFSGTTFGGISIGAGSTVTFTQSVINVGGITLQQGTTTNSTRLSFAQGTVVKSTGAVSVAARSVVNPGNQKVVFYLGTTGGAATNFNVAAGGNITVDASIFTPNGNLVVGGDPSNTTNMTGKFIANQITSNGSNVIWNSYDCASAPVLPTKLSTDELPTKIDLTTQEDEMSIQVTPNPSSSFFTLVIQSTSKEAADVRVFDMAGRQVDQKRGAVGESIRFGNMLAQGMYIVEVLQGNHQKLMKVIKN